MLIKFLLPEDFFSSWHALQFACILSFCHPCEGRDLGFVLNLGRLRMTGEKKLPGALHKLEIDCPNTILEWK